MSLEQSWYGAENEPKALAMPYWVAGFFEVTGSIFFDIQEPHGERRRSYAYPVMMVTDNSFERISNIQALMGGTIRKTRNSSWTWGLYQSEKVVQISEMLDGKSPSRVEILLAILNWENADLDARLIIAQEIMGKTKDYDLNPSDYTELVNKPQFVAGVFDGKALFERRNVDIYSTNGALLTAMRAKFGGSLWIQENKGNYLKEELGRSISINNPVFGYRLYFDQASEMLSTVGPYLQIRKSSF